MTSRNPIQLVKELCFKDTSASSSFLSIDYPNQLRVSPNGKHIALSNLDNLYLFDLADPESGWKSRIANPCRNGVVPTDSGGFWVDSGNDVQFVSRDGDCMLSVRANGCHKLWGNDNWLLIHDNKHIRFANTRNLCLQSTSHKHMILHAWMHGSAIRLLSLSKKKKYLYLHEWMRNGSRPILITKCRYKHEFSVSGVSACYPIAEHVHAWPLEHDAVLVKMMPWAITVSADGKITVCNDHVAWHPVSFCDKTELSRQKLTELTACALEKGLDPTSGFSRTPFLITTLEHQESIHFISSLWHKKLLKADIKWINDELLNECLDDIDVAAMVLANAEHSLPAVENMAQAILTMQNEKKYRSVVHSQNKLFQPLFENTFPLAIKEFIELLEKNQFVGLSNMSDILGLLSKYPMLIGPFFSALYGERVSRSDRGIVISTIQLLLPVLSKKIRSVIPGEISASVPQLIKTLEHAEPRAAKFLVNKARKRFFDIDTVVVLLNLFSSDEFILDMIFSNISKNRSALMNQPGIWEDRVQQSFEKLLRTCHEFTTSDILRLMLEHGIDIPDAGDSSDIGLARLIQNSNTPASELAEYLAQQMISDPQLPPQCAQTILNGITTRHLIPTYIHGMVEIACAMNSSELAILAETSGEQLHHDHMLIEVLWKQADGLDEISRWAFAVTLLEAMKSCMGDNAINSISSGHSYASSDSRLTAEARLLQKNMPQQSYPIQEMLDCINSETGMSDAHRKVSMTVLQQYKTASLTSQVEEII